MMRRPFVTANFAVTIDGRISTRSLTPADFSSRRDKRRLLEIRAECDAVLAGARTIAADNMTMGLPAADLRAARRAKGIAEYPLRVLVTNRGRIDPGLRVFEQHISPLIIFSTERMPLKVRRALSTRATVRLEKGAVVDLGRTLGILRRDHGVRRLVCEGGARLLRGLLDAHLVDELHVTLCPRVFGGARAPTLTGIAGAWFLKSARLDLRAMEVHDGECFLRYRILR